MARVTVEDCVERVSNRFELVMLAAQRSRDVSAGSPLTVDRDNDKNPVVALREIADATIELDSLQNTLVKGLQKHVEIDEPEEDILDIMSSEELLGVAEDLPDPPVAASPDAGGAPEGGEDSEDGAAADPDALIGKAAATPESDQAPEPVSEGDVIPADKAEEG